MVNEELENALDWALPAQIRRPQKLQGLASKTIFATEPVLVAMIMEADARFASESSIF